MGGEAMRGGAAVRGSGEERSMPECTDGLPDAAAGGEAYTLGKM